MHGSWYLDGAYFGSYNGLKEKTLDKLKRVGVIDGVTIFEDPEMPNGTLELKYGDTTRCIIRGTGQTAKEAD